MKLYFCFIASIVVFISGCGTQILSNVVPKDDYVKIKEIAENFSSYALMSSDVYKTSGKNWAIERKINLPDLNNNMLKKCGKESNWFCDHINSHQLKLTEDRREEEDVMEAKNNFSGNLDECNSSDPPIPIINEKDHGWRRVTEIEKYKMPKGWYLFVPDLAIEVWENLSDDFDKEYVIAFRGTKGKGGWLSNFRPVTNLLPVFWDQYKQSLDSVERIVDQIYAEGIVRQIGKKSNKISEDFVNQNKNNLVRPKITITGHSLGAALATHAYLNIRGIDRVVGFNPSPFDGRRLFPLSRREEFKDFKYSIDDSPITYVVEVGEVLGEFSPCVDGPIWGGEGGPKVKCVNVNLSAGSTFKQHEINRMACKLNFYNLKISQ